LRTGYLRPIEDWAEQLEKMVVLEPLLIVNEVVFALVVLVFDYLSQRRPVAVENDFNGLEEFLAYVADDEADPAPLFGVELSTSTIDTKTKRANYSSCELQMKI